MNKMNKLFVFLLIGIFLAGLTSATLGLGIVKQNDCINLYQTCPSCSYVNLTVIKYPNASIETTNLAMTKSNSEYTYTFCNTTTIGEYFYTVEGDKDGTISTETISFEVTPNGKEFKSTNSIAYLGFILILLFTFFLTMYGAGKIEWRNKKNNEGKILTVNNFRYVKILLYVLSYFELMFLFGLSYKTFSEAGIEGFTQFFNFIYQLFLNLIYPLMILLIIFIFVTWINNKKLHQRLNLGLEN